jgi:hypothetical protein
MTPPSIKTFCATVLAFSAAGTYTAAPTEKDRKLLKDVSQALLPVCDPAPGLDWPPDFDFLEERGINAFATAIYRDGKLVPIVRVTNDMIEKVIEGDPHRMAYVLGHELGHLLKGHIRITKADRERAAFVKTVFGRDKEIEADRVGATLAVKAGYSFEKGLKAILRMKELGLDYSSFEGLGLDHPSWDTRLERMDTEKAQLWKAMAAFNNGVVFLVTEQFGYAEACFEKVVKEFPNAYEAWANLGFARLMRYCDQLDKADLREFGIGQIVTGGFYFRAEAIKVRGRNADLWKAAVAALNESNRIKSDQTRVIANLGLAYLIHPDGKNTAEASRFLSAAAITAEREGAHPLAHAGLLINLGVATLDGAKSEAGLARLDEGEKLVLSLTGGTPLKRAAPSYDAAIVYTRALALAGGKD